MVVVDGIYLAEQETKIRFHLAKKMLRSITLWEAVSGDF